MIGSDSVRQCHDREQSYGRVEVRELPSRM